VLAFAAVDRLRERRLLTLFRGSGFRFVPEGEVYPLVLSIAILIQSITFAGAQGTGLDSLFGGGCTTVSQLMLPGGYLGTRYWIVWKAR
jgi:hypothetical protein